MGRVKDHYWERFECWDRRRMSGDTTGRVKPKASTTYIYKGNKIEYWIVDDIDDPLENGKECEPNEERNQGMHESRNIFLISDDVYCVRCSYDKDSFDEGVDIKEYKTFDDSLVPGDYVAIPTKTRHKMTVVRVEEVKAEPDLETSAAIDWIIGKVDTEMFNQNVAAERRANEQIKAAQRRKKREELREALAIDASAVKAFLPSHTASEQPNADTATAPEVVVKRADGSVED